MLRFRLYLTAIASAVALAPGRGVGAERRQRLGVSPVPCWVSSVSVDRSRLRIERRLLAPAATRGAVAPAEQ